MSKISQELKVLLYLNERYSRTRWVTINEIADYLDVSQRQARRYLEDLNAIPEITVVTKLGRDGGYKLERPLDKGFAMPENIVLAMSIAMKNNERIESVLSELPNYVVTNCIAGDNALDNDILDNLEIIIKAIQNQKELAFSYQNIPDTYLVDPYRIVLTNHTYYLFARHDDKTKTFDVGDIHNLRQLGAFKPSDKVNNEINDKLTRYGIKDDEKTTLRVKCKSVDVLNTFDKYYEGKGTKDSDNLTYTVIGNSANELYYPLFRISTKKYEFLDKDFKDKYIKYLKKQIISLGEMKWTKMIYVNTLQKV